MINFPNNPKVGDAFTQGGTIYTCMSLAPIVWNAAPAAAGIADAPTDGKTYGRNTAAWKALDKTDVGLGNVDNTADINKPVSTAQSATFEPKIAIGSSAQYWRGDKTWQTLNKAAVGLPNADNTADLSKTVSSALYLRSGATAAGALIPFTWVDDSTQPTYLWGGESFEGKVYHWSRVKSGKTATVEGASGGTISSAVTVNGLLTGTAEIRAGSHVWAENGSAFGLVSNGNYPYLRFTGDNWRLQMERTSGALMYVHPNNTQLMTLGGGGALTVTGQIVSTSGGDAISCPNGNISTNQMLFAAGPGVRTTGPVNADGRVTGGDLYANGPVYTNSVGGLRPQGYNNNGAGTLWNIVANTDPGWGLIDFQAYHVQGAWAGLTFFSGANGNIQFHISTGQFWGSVKALSFDAQSDATTKEALMEIPSALDVIDGIKAHTYKFIQVERDDDAPVYGADRRYAGTMAQDWESRLPEAVSEATTNTGIVTKMLDYAAISAVNVQATSELLQRVKAIESRLTALEA